MEKLIIGASIGNCVHVGGVSNFLQLARQRGYQTKFLGPAVKIDYLLDAVQESEPEVVAVGYRLTPETAERVLNKLKDSVEERGLTKFKYIFGGTLPVANVAKKVGLFDVVFSGEETLAEIIAFLDGKEPEQIAENYADNLLDRIADKKPYPLIRHHYGQPTMEATLSGIKKIAKSKVVDIISLGPDQNAQESFFRPAEMNETEKGAGGVPIRTAKDLQNLYKASRYGNFPLLRSYSGTRDVFKMAKLLIETINNAWAAVPLSWYNELDGRGPRDLLTGIKENQELMRWHGKNNIPVEVNEAHHWSLRDAHDTIAVAMAYLGAYNAKKMGVKDFIAQYMFNNPAQTSGPMDLAKMLAKKELIESLVDKEFKVYTQVRAGLASFPLDLDRAKGQLAYATFLGMALEPDLVHVVGFSEADHAARAGDVIESCKIASQVIYNSIAGYPDFLKDQTIQKRKDQLLEEADILLEAIKNLGSPQESDSLASPEVLARAIKSGLLDAPHLQGNQVAAGKLETKMVNGACYAYDFSKDKVLTESARIIQLSN